MEAGARTPTTPSSDARAVASAGARAARPERMLDGADPARTSGVEAGPARSLLQTCNHFAGPGETPRRPRHRPRPRLHHRLPPHSRPQPPPPFRPAPAPAPMPSTCPCTRASPGTRACTCVRPPRLPPRPLPRGATCANLPATAAHQGCRTPNCHHRPRATSGEIGPAGPTPAAPAQHQTSRTNSATTTRRARSPVDANHFGAADDASDNLGDPRR